MESGDVPGLHMYTLNQERSAVAILESLDMLSGKVRAYHCVLTHDGCTCAMPYLLQENIWTEVVNTTSYDIVTYTLHTLNSKRSTIAILVSLDMLSEEVHFEFVTTSWLLTDTYVVRRAPYFMQTNVWGEVVNSL